MDKAEIAEKLKQLIEKDTDESIASHDEKLDLDSYTMMLTITFVKEELGVELDMDTLDFDAFTSLNTLADLVLQKAKVTALSA